MMAGRFDRDEPNGVPAEVSDIDIAAETERLLSIRTRDLVLRGAMLERYRAYSWSQRSKIVRAWMIWVIGLSISSIGINAVIIPDIPELALLVCGLVIPLASATAYAIWRQPRTSGVEGMSIVVWTIVVMTAAAVLGVKAGGPDHERYLAAALFIGTIALMVLRIELVWTHLMALAIFFVYLAVALVDPAISSQEALALSAFYSLGLCAVVAARKTATILSQRSFLLSLRDQQRREALAEANRRLAELASIDPLTGIANRRSAMTHIEAIWTDAARRYSGVAMIMADIDHFKRLNDTLGHAVGDDCLRQVARAIESSIRAGQDTVSRHGGEEFLVVLTEAPASLAEAIAERIRFNVEALGIANPEAPGGILTLSLGIAFAERGARPELVTKWADDALYEAKRQGRNRVRSALSPAATQSSPQARGFETLETPGAAVASLA